MSEFEYEAQMVMNHVDEAKADAETAEMIDAVNMATEGFRREEESARIASRMGDIFRASERNEKKQQALARKHRRRKWQAVKRCGMLLMGVAAVFGFEARMGLPHGLSLGCMAMLLIMTAYVAVGQVIPEVRWYLRHKAVRVR